MRADGPEAGGNIQNRTNLSLVIIRNFLGVMTVMSLKYLQVPHDVGLSHQEVASALRFMNLAFCNHLIF